MDEFGSRHEALKAAFASAFERGKGNGEIFALRLQHHSFAYFAEQLSLLYPSLFDDKSRFQAAFGRTLFIHLTRKNKLEQAISYVKAAQSGLWHIASDGTELERLSAPREPFYDREMIASQRDAFTQMEAAWQAWFAQEQIEPLQVTYDELSAAPYATLGRVLRAIGLAAEPIDERTPPVAKLADAINREWFERFQCEAKR